MLYLILNKILFQFFYEPRGHYTTILYKKYNKKCLEWGSNPRVRTQLILSQPP